MVARLRRWRLQRSSPVSTNRSFLTINYAALLETYTLNEILEFNDLTEEDILEFLHEEGYVNLPEIKPLEFD